MSNKSYSTTKVVTDAYLAVTQNLSQSLEAQQLLALRCDSPEKASNCEKCLTWWDQHRGNFNKSPKQAWPDFVNGMCAPVCNCHVNDLTMGQTITINFSSFLKSGAQKQFFNQIKNSLAQKASQNGGGLPSDQTSNISDTSNDLYTAMRNETFQSSLQGLSAMQVVSVQGPSSVVTVNLTQAIDFISNMIESNSVVNNAVNNLDNKILEISSRITTGSMNEIIEWIIQIVLFVIILVVLFFSIDLIIDTLTLALI